MKHTACLTLDLEPSHAGLTGESYDLWKTKYTDSLYKLLNSFGIPLSVFVVGKSLYRNSKFINHLLSYNSEFHLHSYSHLRDKPDSKDEIKQGKEAFKDFFGKFPSGYRAPEGRITKKGLSNLDKESFVFDSSIFPSFWPHPKYLVYDNKPFKPEGVSSLIEIPLTCLAPLRLPFSLSFVKLFGFEIYENLLTRKKIANLIFSFHLHDIWRSLSFPKLPYLWRRVYSRNKKKGFYFLEKLIKKLASMEYTFLSMNQFVDWIKEKNL